MRVYTRRTNFLLCLNNDFHAEDSHVHIAYFKCLQSNIRTSFNSIYRIPYFLTTAQIHLLARLMVSSSCFSLRIYQLGFLPASLSQMRCDKTKTKIFFSSSLVTIVPSSLALLKNSVGAKPC